jgi:hypothetical protein
VDLLRQELGAVGYITVDTHLANIPGLDNLRERELRQELGAVGYITVDTHLANITSYTQCQSRVS